LVHRAVEVVAIDVDRVALRALAACSDCAGCGGHCNLLGPAAGNERLQLPLDRFPRTPRTGEQWLVALAEDELLEQSLRGYGAALAGLVLGAGAGHIVALAFGLAPDVPTAAAALAGTILAIRLSKRDSVAGLRIVAAPDCR
jgi:hypothetical protein